MLDANATTALVVVGVIVAGTVVLVIMALVCQKRYGEFPPPPAPLPARVPTRKLTKKVRLMRLGGGTLFWSALTLYFDFVIICAGVQEIQSKLSGVVLWLALFMLPFNLIMVVLWGLLLVSVVVDSATAYRLAAGIRTMKYDDAVGIRLLQFPPLAGAITALTLSSFIGGFATFWYASVEVMTVTWALVLGAGMLVYVLLALRAVSGKEDLVIDRRHGTLTMPQTFGRQEQIVVPLADLVTVDVVVVEKMDEGTITYKHFPTLRWRDARGEPREGKLAELDNEDLARWLAGWIADRAGLPAAQITS